MMKEIMWRWSHKVEAGVQQTEVEPVGAKAKGEPEERSDERAQQCLRDDGPQWRQCGAEGSEHQGQAEDWLCSRHQEVHGRDWLWLFVCGGCGLMLCVLGR